MAAKVRIELNHDGIRELLCSAPIGAECEKAARQIASAAGDGFVVLGGKVNSFGGGRIGYAVSADTYEAKLAEAEDRALSKAVTQCRS